MICTSERKTAALPTVRARWHVKRAETLPSWLIQTLDNPPRAGAGVHPWLFTTARQLLAHYSAPRVEAILEAAVRGCGRHVPKREIQDAVRAASACAWRPAGAVSPPSPCKEAAKRWPEVDPVARAEAAKTGGVAELWETSRVRPDGAAPDAEALIDLLFPGDPLLCCCGAGHGDFDTRLRSEWRGRLGLQTFIVPSPMTARTGLRKSDGRASAHTLDNTGPRRFLVIEQDCGELDEQAGVLLHLAERAPLTMVVFSGGKSLHGWFYCAGQPEGSLRRFMERAATLGADRATWTRSQFVRMPNGVRKDGARQTVYFLNPEVLP